MATSDVCDGWGGAGRGVCAGRGVGGSALQTCVRLMCVAAGWARGADRGVCGVWGSALQTCLRLMCVAAGGARVGVCVRVGVCGGVPYKHVYV